MLNIDFHLVESPMELSDEERAKPSNFITAIDNLQK